ncbi:hypothetical protein WP50_25055 [Lactiplantibacillus plantarum]|nr:hypothetical protein WP50_25055 [Lactiplantibacillus plantarum]
MRTNNEIVDTLVKLKDEQNLTLSELARRVNMAKSALSRYFNKLTFPVSRLEYVALLFQPNIFAIYSCEYPLATLSALTRLKSTDIFAISFRSRLGTIKEYRNRSQLSTKCLKKIHKDYLLY